MGEIIAAVITVLGVVGTAVVTFFQFKKQEWGKLVSESRNKWLNDFRDEFAVIAGYIEFQKYSYSKLPHDDTKRCEELLKALNAKNKLYTRINTNSSPDGNEYNDAYKRLLESLDFDNVKLFDFDLFKKLTNLILEKEWQKVKKETKGD